MYFEAAGEEGGEVKLVTGATGASKITTTSEPSSASSNQMGGARLSLAGSFSSDQAKNVETFTVK